ncbi:hypothetical protein FOA52_001181 [Chlamydomonas sp. UWO 241]|nr:hypothetical protein FOA52_001181 [Chlamydomonas sp. UWO 241]
MRAYVVVEAVVAVGTLGLVDAAFSGDWSRIGVISTDTEDVLKLLVYFVAAAHSCTAVAAAFAAQKQGSNPGIALVKGFVFGSLGLYEVMQGGGAPAQDDRSMEEQ